MEERPYDPELTKELLKDKPEIELHGLDGNHHKLAPAYGKEFGGNRAARRQKRNARRRRL